jgi:hypothetical protein
VVLDITQAYAPVGFRHDSDDIHRRSAACNPDGDAIRSITVNARDFVIGAFSSQLFLVLIYVACNRR